MSRQVDWYFDFVSPFAYLCLHRLGELPPQIEINFRPILFAGLLKHHGQKGPAEIESKRQYTYRHCQWWADSHGIAFRFPAAHPFNPLHHLRLAIAAGSSEQPIRAIFEALWTSGADPADGPTFDALARTLGVKRDALASPAIKDRLRANTDAALAAGVFGVPTFVVEGERFWGLDSFDFLLACLGDASILSSPEMRRLDALPVGAARRA